MAADIGRIVSVLRRGYLFQGLETAQLARVASFFERQLELGVGEVVFLEGDPPDYFYVILEGKVRVTRKARGKQVLLNLLGPGDFFGEQALIFDDPRSATVQTVGPTILLRLSRARFALLLKEYPEIRSNLTATAASRKRARGLKFDWLGPEEVIYYISGRHRVFLGRALIGPVLVLGISLFLGVFPLVSLIASAKPITIGLITGLGVLFLILAIAWGTWNYIDWSNDYYIITSQRVVWQEKIVGLYDSRREAPLNAVMAVNVASTQTGRILNFGNVEVRTFTGSINFLNADSPYLFAAFVEGCRKRVMALSKEQEYKQIEEDLEKALLEKAAPPEEIVPAVAPPPPPITKKIQPKKKGGFGEWWRNFLKVRYQDGNVITYRKHWFVLLAKTWLPLILLLGGFALTSLLIVSKVIPPLILVPVSLILIGVFAWLAYNYADWSNDIYRLTPDQILDIERKPLGRETKKSANLDAPDFRVEHARDNPIQILLNFGTVKVNVGQTPFIFYNVYNPDQVHQDIADYREALIRKKREDEAKRERERMLNWLVAYYQETEKLEKPENNSEESDLSR
jgi:hypothetical protein